jgi:hypothetical protein
MIQPRHTNTEITADEAAQIAYAIEELLIQPTKQEAMKCLKTVLRTVGAKALLDPIVKSKINSLGRAIKGLQF